MKTPILVQAILPPLLFCVAVVFGGDASAGPSSIGSLKTKDRIVEIHSGEHESLYTVKTLDGEWLARHLSLEMLSQNFPDLGKTERGVADDASLYPHDLASSDTVKLDAGL